MTVLSITDPSDDQTVAPEKTESPKMKENDELLRLAKEGDRDAQSKLVENNLPLVHKIALRFQGRGTEYEDLVQIGTIGMLRAISGFDFSFGTTFTTYAVPLIIGEIKRHLRDTGPIKVSRTLRQNGMTLMREHERFTAEKGREPRISELAELCGISTAEAAEALEACSAVCSLSSPAGDEDGLTLEGIISDPDDPIAASADRIALGEAIRSLPSLQRRIITLRYFRNCSQQKTGELLGLSQVKISREEKKIIERLRKAL